MTQFPLMTVQQLIKAQSLSLRKIAQPHNLSFSENSPFPWADPSMAPPKGTCSIVVIVISPIHIFKLLLAPRVCVVSHFHFTSSSPRCTKSTIFSGRPFLFFLKLNLLPLPFLIPEYFKLLSLSFPHLLLLSVARQVQMIFFKEPVYHRRSYIKQREDGKCVHDQLIMVGYRSWGVFPLNQKHYYS
jgi:hypothetical protein